MKILLFGKNGQVGWELQRSLSALGEVIAPDRHGNDSTTGLHNGLCGDLTNLEGLAATVQAVRPNVIVNAAAHTAVDKAESEPELAQLLNATAPGVLAAEAERIGAWLVHYSTDYVFDGTGSRAWTEADPTAPLSVYGRTKQQGEQRIQLLCSRHLIFRTSWVYSARGGNFAKTMLRLAAERDQLAVINDQFGAPTGADLLADVTALALRTVLARSQPERAGPSVSFGLADLAGIYHLVAGGCTTWHAYASLVIDHARRTGKPVQVAQEAILPVPTSQFPTPAQRPANSRLDTARLQQAFGLTLPDWQQGVLRMLAEIP